MLASLIDLAKYYCSRLVMVAWIEMGSSDSVLNELITPRDEDTEQNWVGRNAGSLFRRYKSQALAFVGATTGSFPAFVLVAGLMIVFTVVGKAGTSGWKLVLLPYAVTVTLLTVSSANFLNAYAIEWENIDEAVSKDLRKGPTEGRPLGELLILYTAGLTFITGLILVFAMAVWVVTAATIPSAGPYLAVVISTGILLTERWLVKEKQKSMTAIGVNIAKWLMKRRSKLSSRDRVILDAKGQVTKSFIAATVAGTVNV